MTTITPTVRRATVRFIRSREDAFVAGVAGGLSGRWGVDPVYVRICFAVLTFAGGVGLALYLLAWALSLEPQRGERTSRREPEVRQALALGAIVFGAVLLLRAIGLWFGDAIGLPVVLAAVGAATVYTGADEEGRRRWARIGVGAVELPSGRAGAWRIAAGGALALVGVGVFLTSRQGLTAIGSVFLAVMVTSAGILLVFGPWVWRLLNEVSDERRDRIRSEERAEMAAHLHDSVLQTLALIQSNTANPRKMVSLARRQERELRSWLYAGRAATDPERLEAAVQAVAQDVEQGHDLPVEVVVVGDAVLDEATRALVAATREAANNAAAHSGASVVSIFVECEPDVVNAYVRDGGVGFDPDGIREDRRGIADSIRGRIERQGGKVIITSVAGEGTEVQMSVPTGSS